MLNRFRWVFCQLDALQHCFPPNLRQYLNELPETLDETYERILKGINKAQKENAHRLLQCLTVAVRPLLVEELAESLAFDFQAKSVGGIPTLKEDWRLDDEEEAVLSTCSSLIAIIPRGKSRVVQFSHFSVKEYLTSDRLARSSGDVSRYHIVLEPAHTILAQACLGVLLRLDDRVNVGDTDPLVKYASRHWVDHAQFENVASRIRDVMEYFFDADKPHWTAWCRVQKVDVPWWWFTSNEVLDDVFPLYYASLGGFYDLAEHLVGKHPEHINARGGQTLIPLVAALYRKHFQVAELLHRHGADIDVLGDDKSTPLLVACVDGSVDVVRWLLDHGAGVNARDRALFTPLHRATEFGRLQVVQLLIEHNADIHGLTISGLSPLHMAATPYNMDNQIDIMQILLDHGANPNARDINNATPLRRSSWSGTRLLKGTVEGTRLLLKHGAIIDTEDNEGRTPLQIALEHGHEDIATCLKEHGATR